MAEEQAQAVEEKEEQKAAEETPAAEEPKKEESNLSSKLQDVLKTIEELTVLELADLVKALEDKFGVSAAAAVAVAAPGAAAGGGGGDAGAAEEKTSFDVILASAGDKKIQVIKEIRAVTSLGLKEAKDLVEAAPKAIKEGASKEDAEKIKKQLEDQGAKVEIK